MAYSRINKITIKELTFIIIIPTFVLLLCLKGMVGNFNTEKKIQSLQARHDKFEMSGNAFEFSRTRSLFLTTISIAELKQFNIPENIYLFGGNDVGYINQKFFSWAPPGTAIIGASFYKIFNNIDLGQLGTYSSVLIISVINLFLIYKLVLVFISKNKNTAILSGYIYTFANISFVYSITYFQHQYTVFFLCLMSFGIWKTKKEKKVSPTWSYIIPNTYGLSVFFDYPNLIILFPLIFSWFLLYYELPKNESKKILLRSVIMILFWVSVLLNFNQKNFGIPIQMSNTLPRPDQMILNNFDQIRQSKNNILNIFQFNQIVDGLKTYTIDQNRGLFFFTPILLLGILGLKQLYIKHIRFFYLSLCLIGINTLLYASFGTQSGGWCFGPRYLLPTTLILSISTALWIENASLTKKIIISPLLLLSILNNLSGALTTLTIPETINTTYYGVRNFRFILNNTSGSFVYNILIYPYPLIYYFIGVLIILIISFYKIYIPKN